MVTDHYALAAEADDARRIEAQRDDALTALTAVTPLAQAALDLRRIERAGSWVTSPAWSDALARLRDAADRYIDTHGTGVEQP